MANARQFMWMQGEFTGLAHPVWSSPSGYFSPSIPPGFRRVRGRAAARNPARRRLRGAARRTARSSRARRRRCIPKLRRLLEETRPSIIGLLGGRRLRANADTRTCIRLMGEEVLPAVREIGKELGLWSPFEANAPTGRKFLDPAVPAGAA